MSYLLKVHIWVDGLSARVHLEDVIPRSCIRPLYPDLHTSTCRVGATLCQQTDAGHELDASHYSRYAISVSVKQDPTREGSLEGSKCML